MNYVASAVSLGMLDVVAGGTAARLDVRSVEIDSARAWVREREWVSIVGHHDTAELISVLLYTVVNMRRASTSLQPGDELLVAQYNGPRLPEGATTLPEGAKIRWLVVAVSREEPAQ